MDRPGVWPERTETAKSFMQLMLNIKAPFAIKLELISGENVIPAVEFAPTGVGELLVGKASSPRCRLLDARCDRNVDICVEIKTAEKQA